MSFVLKNQAQTELDDVNKKIASIQDIETIVKDYENAESGPAPTDKREHPT